jgi:hypothetical protein
VLARKLAIASGPQDQIISQEAVDVRSGVLFDRGPARVLDFPLLRVRQPRKDGIVD